ncbi:MAG: hypothetical protein IJH12_03760 [Clostridia bacterium]|nr:hypothetical protein [Clostridia bacterium]
MNANYFNFMAGQAVTIREIISRKNDPNVDLVCFEVALVESSEVVKLDVLSEKAHLVSVGTVFKYCSSGDEVGYTIWQNGMGPIEF